MSFAWCSTHPITQMLPQVQALPYGLPSVTARISTNEMNIATAPYTRKAPYQYGWDWGPRYVHRGNLATCPAGNVGLASDRRLSHTAASDH